MEYANVEFHVDAIGEFRWRLRVRNGNIIAESGEGYTSKAGCEAGWDRTVTYLQGMVEEVRSDEWKASKSKSPKKKPTKGKPKKSGKKY